MRQVEGLPCHLQRSTCNLTLAILFRQMRKVGQWQRHLCRGRNYLNRLSIGFGKGGSERFMSARDLGQASLQRVKVQWPAKVHHLRNVVYRIVWLKLIQEPQALLRERCGHGPHARRFHQRRYDRASLRAPRRVNALRQSSQRRLLEHRP